MFRKILIANRGEIARRVIRTCRELGIGTVAVFSEPDRRALHVREADEAVALGGATAAESYLSVDGIIAAAQKTGAGAVHPGYGFLAENAAFACACERAGLMLIGPPADVIAAMGSKIEAKARMQAADVPVLPSVAITDQTPEQLLSEAEQLGWPVLVKASAGGGGRGMRIVDKAAALLQAIEDARREAESAFGDDTVFLEPYVLAPRHVEFQILGDVHGAVIHLFERECSIQRRHQKIIEEAPCVVLDDQIRAAMGDAAVRAGKAIGYVGAGTVEFLLTAEREFYFLEVNTRLQVEHPVTEAVTGLDLVRLQIEIAAGRPLPPEARGATINGHAIEARLYAEDPARDFRPVTGRLHGFAIPQPRGVRVDSGVAAGDEISPYYDSMLAKVIAHGETRDEAAAALSAALRRTVLHGLQTNRELLVRLIEHPEFQRGEFNTRFLERHPPAELSGPLIDAGGERLHAVAAALAAQAHRRARAAVQGRIPSGWRNNPSQLQEAAFEGVQGRIDVGYRFVREGLMLKIDGEDVGGVRVCACAADAVVLEVGSVQRSFAVRRVADDCFVDSVLGSCVLREIDRFPLPDEEQEAGSLVAPLPGVVNELRAGVGDVVEAGAVLIVIESMKMLHPIVAPAGGRVAEIRVAVTDHVDTGAVLAVIEETQAE